jgi:hypothetical protein
MEPLKISNYYIHDFVHSGAFGKIFSAINNDTNEKVALKMIRNNFKGILNSLLLKFNVIFKLQIINRPLNLK